MKNDTVEVMKFEKCLAMLGDIARELQREISLAPEVVQKQKGFYSGIYVSCLRQVNMINCIEESVRQGRIV